MKLPGKLQKEIIDLLLSLPNIQDSDGQKAFISRAAIESKLENQLPFGKPASDFVPLLVRVALKYEKSDDGRYPLEAILQTAKEYVGIDKQQHYDNLIQRLYSNPKTVGHPDYKLVQSHPDKSGSSKAIYHDTAVLGLLHDEINKYREPFKKNNERENKNPVSTPKPVQPSPVFGSENKIKKYFNEIPYGAMVMLIAIGHVVILLLFNIIKFFTGELLLGKALWNTWEFFLIYALFIFPIFIGISVAIEKSKLWMKIVIGTILGIFIGVGVIFMKNRDGIKEGIIFLFVAIFLIMLPVIVLSIKDNIRR
ncbi:hypothetical protein U14_01936 [Candidatus Moduliflexus flocculans]|uniref:Effector-associated domain-containing protein n=1 Tax=Candidatus Moduliflexus flocculans TaxID=1499966 RepID=A0A0S6VXF5_9BACT|nr:hypothetical protein U14_01936 [Candidatus Moduliflexus flocculans]